MPKFEVSLSIGPRAVACEGCQDVSQASPQTRAYVPPLIFPGQQIQSLCTLGQRLRDIIEGNNKESHDETLKSLESLREIPISLRGPKHLMKRRLCLLDLRNGRGLGFTVEHFFLAVSELELTKCFYAGTFWG